MGALSLISIWYFATGNNQVIKELLEIAGTDLSSDVWRFAVLAIAFVLIKKRNRFYILMKMLSSSYNAYVRHAVALGIGIVFSASFEKWASLILWKLLEDKTDFVR